MRKEIAVTLAVTMMLTFGGCGKKDAVEKKDENVKTVFVERAISEDINKNLRVGGEIDAYDEVTVTSDTGGDIDAVYKVNGQWVKKGEAVVKLSNDQIEATYKRAEAAYLASSAAYEKSKKYIEDQNKDNLAVSEMQYVSAKMRLQKAQRGEEKETIDNARSRVETAKKNYEVSKINYDKNVKLYNKQLISEQDFLNLENQFKSNENAYDTAKRDLALLEKGTVEEDMNTLKATYKSQESSYNLTKRKVTEKSWNYDLQSIKAQYLADKANYELAKKQYDKLTLKAEINGVVANLDLKKGNKLAASTPAFSVINNDDMQLSIGVDENNISGINKFNNVSVEIPALAKKFTGVVSEVNPVADAKTRKFGIKIKIKNGQHEIKKGMYAIADVAAGVHKGTVVPKAAIVVSGINSYVFKIENNTAKKVQVEIGDENNNRQEVSATDIKEGDLIAVEGNFLLSDGEKVKVGQK